MIDTLKLRDAETLIVTAYQCIEDTDNDDITDHYDCKADIETAITKLQEAIA